MNGNRLLATLVPSDHFGEANSLFNWTRRRTASVISTQITKLGVIDANSMTILIEAYPSWTEILLKTTIDRLKETFNASDMAEVQSRLRELT